MESEIVTEGKYRVSRNFYIICIISFGIIASSTYFENITYFIQSVSALGLSIFSLIILSVTKNEKLPLYITIGLTIIIIAAGFTTSTFNDNQGEIFWIIVITLFSYYIIGKRIALVYLTITVGNMILVKILSINNVITLKYDHVEPTVLSEINYILNLLAASILFIYLVEQILKEFNTAQKKLLESNAMLITKDSEKSIMLREIHHRVKNNLQVIISLLRLQLFQLDNQDAVSGPFQDSISRVSTMSMIHEKMYKGDTVNNLIVKDYVADLADDLVRTYSTNTKIILNVESNIPPLKMDDLVPFSLILNELVTNSIKHGFRNCKNGLIDIKLSQSDIGFNFSYNDSGEWLDNGKTNSFGLELIETLSGHFDGVYTVNKSQNGTEFAFQFKLY